MPMTTKQVVEAVNTAWGTEFVAKVKKDDLITQLAETISPWSNEEYTTRMLSLNEETRTWVITELKLEDQTEEATKEPEPEPVVVEKKKAGRKAVTEEEKAAKVAEKAAAKAAKEAEKAAAKAAKVAKVKAVKEPKVPQGLKKGVTYMLKYWLWETPSLTVEQLSAKVTAAGFVASKSSMVYTFSDVRQTRGVLKELGLLKEDLVETPAEEPVVEETKSEVVETIEA